MIQSDVVQGEWLNKRQDRALFAQLHPTVLPSRSHSAELPRNDGSKEIC